MPAIDHIRHLAETIGPRGSTTPQEAEAARYAADVLRRLGLEPVTEPFTSARSAWYPYALFSGLALLAEVLFWAAGRIDRLARPLRLRGGGVLRGGGLRPPPPGRTGTGDLDDAG